MRPIPGEPQTCGGRLSHGGFRLVAGRAPTGNHLVTHTLCHLFWVLLSHEHHPTIHVFPFTRCLRHTPTHFLPLSLQVVAICNSIYWTLSDGMCRVVLPRKSST